MIKNYRDIFRACFEESETSTLIKEKAHWVNKLLPAQRIVDIGGMWRCNGFYSFFAVAEGAEEVILLDTLTTDRFNQINQNFLNVKYIKIDFYKAMLSDEFMNLGHKFPAEGAICYDVLLHQPEPIHFINNIIHYSAMKRIVFGNPVAEKSKDRSDLFFVPFSNEFKQKEGDIRYAQDLHDHGGWVWVFSHGFLLNCMKYLNLYVIEEALIPNWHWKKGLDYSLILVGRK